MKKPGIEILTVSIDEKTNGVYVDGDLLCCCLLDKKSDAVRSMIEALIDARDAIIEIENNVQVNIPERKRIESALKKAGCK